MLSEAVKGAPCWSAWSDHLGPTPLFPTLAFSGDLVITSGPFYVSLDCSYQGSRWREVAQAPRI